MKNILFLVALGLLPLCSHSQTFADDSKWEIGVNFLPFFDTTFYVIDGYNTGWRMAKPLKNSILVKRRISDELLLRSEIGFTIDNKKLNVLSTDGQIDNFSDYEIGGHVSLGFEFILRWNKIIVLVGSELYGSYLRSTSKRHVDTRPLANPPTIYQIRDFVSTRKYGVNGLIGVSVPVMPDLQLVVYSKLKGEYNRIRTDFKRHDSEFFLLTVSGDQIIEHHSFDIIPVSFLGIIYSF